MGMVLVLVLLMIVATMMVVATTVEGVSAAAAASTAHVAGKMGVKAEGAVKARKFVHITDVHLDLAYAAGKARAECKHPPCCREEVGILADPIISTMRDRHRLSSSPAIGADGRGLGTDDDSGRNSRAESEDDEDDDEEDDDDDDDEDEEEEEDSEQSTTPVASLHSEKRMYAGKFGEYSCDTPVALLESAMRAQRHFNPDFIVWTGDTGPHRNVGGGQLPRATVLDSIRRATEIIANSTEALVVPCLGNHDFSPVSQDPGPDASRWLFDAVADEWARWLPGESVAMLRSRGYYQMPLGTGLRAIVLNTQECDILNFYNMVRPGTGSNGEEQLQWLRDSLLETESAGESALIVGHIPPGIWNGCYGNFTERYEDVLAEFPGAVAGQVFGHRHSGSWRVFRDKTDAPSSVALTTPSLTPYIGQDPSFRVYHLSEPEPEAGAAWPAVPPRYTITAMGQFATSLASYVDTDELTWKLSFFMPGSLPFNRTSMSPSNFFETARLLQQNPKVAAQYRELEANGRRYMAHDKEMPAWPCALTSVRTFELIECAHLAEENLMKHYVNMDHNYVITNFFPFEVIYAHFCQSIFHNLTGDPNCAEKAQRLYDTRTTPLL